jgi:long-subunit fatty acid transport protein
VPEPIRTAARLGLALAGLLWAAPARAQSIIRDTDRIDITGRQNLTLGSGARAYGMGGAFLARADDATAASWNPAGLSYLRQPELSLVGAHNAFDISRGAVADAAGAITDSFKGQAIDFGAFTWPIAIGSAGGAVQLSYQRAVSFDGQRRIAVYRAGALYMSDEGQSNGGFDVVAFGTGLRLTRGLRAGFTVNRWLNGYEQTLSRTFYTEKSHPYREFYLHFRPEGWSFNFGLMWSPVESLNVGAVYKTGFSADVKLNKTRADSWGTLSNILDVTTNAHSSQLVQLDFPASYGLGLSWRPRDTLTLSADFTLTRWSQAQIVDYFDLQYTPRDEGGVPAIKPAPQVYPLLQYPSLTTVPTSDDPLDPARIAGQQDKQELRAGVEWVLIKGRLKVPLRAGYFSDRQITPGLAGSIPRFNGFTAGAGIVLGSVLLDVAYVYEFGKYYVATSADTTGGGDPGPVSAGLQAPTPAQRNALTTNRVFASIIYRFNDRP